MRKEIASRKDFLRGLAAGLGLVALRCTARESEEEICLEQPPMGCTFVWQESYKLRPGVEGLSAEKKICVLSPDSDSPEKVWIDLWIPGEKRENGLVYQANCQMLCTHQPPYRKLKKMCEELRLPNGTEICDFKERNRDDLNYQVNDVTLTSLLNKEGIGCEDIKLVFFFVRNMIRIPSGEDYIYAVATLTPPMPDGSRWLTVSEFSDPYEGEEKDRHRTFSRLSGLERVNWLALHEVAEGIASLKGLDLGDQRELWCDEFADEHHQDYRIIQKGKGAQ